MPPESFASVGRLPPREIIEIGAGPQTQGIELLLARDIRQVRGVLMASGDTSAPRTFRTVRAAWKRPAEAARSIQVRLLEPGAITALA